MHVLIFLISFDICLGRLQYFSEHHLDSDVYHYAVTARVKSRSANFLTHTQFRRGEPDNSAYGEPTVGEGRETSGARPNHRIESEAIIMLKSSAAVLAVLSVLAVSAASDVMAQTRGGSGGSGGTAVTRGARGGAGGQGGIAAPGFSNPTTTASPQIRTAPRPLPPGLFPR
jgi:hypothetical protein